MSEEKRYRRHFSAEDKAAVKRHVIGGEPVSAIREDIGVAPNMFYRWQQELFEKGAACKLRREHEKLRAKPAHKDKVIAEITQEYVTLKKSWGCL